MLGSSKTKKNPAIHRASLISRNTLNFSNTLLRTKSQFTALEKEIRKCYSRTIVFRNGSSTFSNSSNGTSTFTSLFVNTS
ncbi:hypothetical protein BWD13_18575 [Leptospira santarosai serovar Grippotyphosa]|nr:hypothetical protein BWD13_18575 [Leptospira santarosai serovar Grippotyphosa]